MASANKSPDAFEAALKRELQRASSSNAVDCPAPDVLAAYYDRALARGERAGVDSHVTSCVRCQSMMASIARADDAASSPMQPILMRRFFWLPRLLAPIAVVGVALAIVIGIRSREHRALEIIALASPVAELKAESPARAPVSAPPDTFEGRTLGVAPAAIPLAQPPINEPVKAARAKIATHRNRIAAKQQNRPDDLAKAENSPAISNPSSDSSLSEYSLATKPASASGGPGALAAGSSAANVMRSDAPGGGAAVSGNAPGFIIVTPRTYSAASPDGSVVWSFGSQGVISRSENSAPSRLVRSGMHRELLAGSAPSNDVCWMVGKSGAILRTLDRGAHWQIVTPPLHTDFTGVRRDG